MPDQFRIGLDKLQSELKTVGKNPAIFPNALVTMFMYVTENKPDAERVLSETLTAFLHRPIDQIRERLLVGPPEACAEKLAAYKKAGVQRLFVWPIKDELDQLTIFQRKVVPLVS
jgi:alkanesulfonate monooxygenase SsuD/methylene tetrahydromethanopterin reductase-like flavin-dependent oxidoreductase (luciferase family)